MNKLFKAAAALAVSAALLIPHSAAMIYAESAAAATTETDNTQTTTEGSQTAETPTDPDGDASSDKSNTSKPVLVGYALTNTSNRAISSISANSEFNIAITIKDIGLKTSEIKGNTDIDFIKSVDSFRGTLKSVEITSQPDELLTYKVTLEKCKWIGGSTDFGFMTGFLSMGSDYSEMSFAVRECRESTGSQTPDYSTAEPLFRITAEQPSAPIRAGDEGTIEFTVKNLGSVEAERVLVEVSASDDLLITDGTGSQDINIIYAGGSDKIKVRYKTGDRISSAKQTFTVNLRYYYDNGNGESMGTATGSASFESVISTIDKVYPVVLSEFDLSEKLVNANEEYSGTVTLNNIGTADMKGVFINFSSNGDFILTGGTSTVFLPELEKGKSYTIPVKIKTLSGFNSLKQDLSVSVRYSYTMGSEDMDGTAENTFTMFANLGSAYAPLPVVSISGQETPISAGHKYRYQVVIENKGELDMDNVTVKLRGGEGISISSSEESAFIAKIPAGGKESIPMSFETAAELVSSRSGVDIDISYFYEDNGRNEQVSTTSSVSMDAIVSGAPVIRMTGNSLGKAVTAKNDYEYTVNLTNYGDIAVKDIYLSFTASDSIYMLDGTEYAHIDSIAAGSVASVKVKFRTTDTIISSKQSIHAKITYSYGVANAEKTAETDGEVSIIAAGASDPSSSNTAAPNVIIGSYSIGSEQIPLEQIPAGDAFDLSLELFNTSSALNVENLVMTVNASGDINIYGGGNTFFYPEMSAAGSISETIPLKAMATAATGTSAVVIGLKYDYIDNGNRQTISNEQTIFVPVYQPDKMSFEVQTPTYTVMAGNQVYITTTYLNKGRSDIANVKAEIEGDIEALSTSKVIGTVVPGGNGSFDFIVTPYMGGECSFTIKITYEDATMTEVTRELPVSFQVEEMYWDDFGGDDWYFPMTMESEGSGGFPWIVLWIGIGVVVVGGVVTLIVLLNVRKKKKKKLTEADIDWEDDLDDVLSDNNGTKV